MAQPPHKAPPPPPPLRTRADDHPPPAVRGGHIEPHVDPQHHPEEHPPIIGVKGLPIEDGSRDPDTIAEIQRRESAEMDKIGVEAWKEARDGRAPEDRPGGRPVPGLHAEREEDKQKQLEGQRRHE